LILLAANSGLLDDSGVDTDVKYSGTWTPEELDYVQGIIDEFEAGNTPDAEDKKSTLRSFIADKLECSEKRISKKVSIAFTVRRTLWLTLGSPFLAPSLAGQP
jgi:hypothetical protein